MSRNRKLVGAGALIVLAFVCLAAAGVVAVNYVLPRLGIAGPQALLTRPVAVEPALVPFALQVIDETSGDIKQVGDIDGDGLPDLVIGGKPEEPLSWYRYPDWAKFQIAVAGNEFTTDGTLGDVDGDGDLDIVVPDGDQGVNLLWFENPRPGGDPTDGQPWTRHEVGSLGSWGKDVELADFDGDGLLDIATRIDTTATIFFQDNPDQWARIDFTDLPDNVLGHEGMSSGDVDGDGYTDLILRGHWLRDPAGADARRVEAWTAYEIGPAAPDFKALVADINLDGQMDVLFSSSEERADVNWWTPENGDPTGPWIKHTILSNMDRAHTLQAADMDLDGDTDVVVGQMHTSAEQEIMVMLNIGGQGLGWVKQPVDVGGLHNGVVADIGNDCDYDIYGANWTGNPPLRLWENLLDQAAPLSRWTFKQVTDQHAQTFGLAFADINGDGQVDIASGRYWYQNPGRDLLGDWVQHEFPAGMHVALALDVDNDEFVDLVAQADETDLAFYWLEAQDPAGESWRTVKIGSVERASHELGAQGYRAAQIEGDARPEVIFASGNGIYYFRIPDDPAGGNWPRVHVNSNPSDEGLAVGDVDGDGQPDIAATTGDSKRVEWYRNPGDGSGEWTAFVIGEFAEALYPDRIGLADFDQDGRLDVVVTEENGETSGAETFWWQQPADPVGGGNWPRFLIVSQGTTNSLDVADMNQDGVPDLVLAEHRGSKNLDIWLNDGHGSFTRLPVDQGRESHLGAQTVDLDGDGDLDLVSIAWDDSASLFLWRNDSANGTCR